MIRVFRLLIPASILALFLTEAVLIFACFAALPYLQSDELYLLYESGWQQILLAESLILLVMYFHHLYEDPRVISRIVLAQQLSLVFGMTFVTQAVIGYWDREIALPRDVLLTGSALSLLAILGCRILYSLAIRNRIGGRRLLFVGLSPTVILLSKFLRLHPEFQMIPVGCVDQTTEGPSPDEKIPLLGSMTDLPRIMEEYRPDWIVVGKRKQIQPRFLDDLIELRFSGLHTEEAASLYETTLGRVRTSEIRPSSLLFSEAWQPNALNLKLQSFYSKAVALILFVLTLPIAASLAIVMKITSQLPRLVRETRVGTNNEPFTFYWFEWPADGGLGSWCRRLGLGAYPQLWNVLRNDMSIVGPSPDRPEFAARLNEAIPFNIQRTAVKPGITGWAKIQTYRFGSPTDAMGRLEYDLYYVKNVSPSLDLSIMLRSIRDALSLSNLAPRSRTEDFQTV